MLGDSGGQRSLESCSPWGHKELYTTQWLNNNNYAYIYITYMCVYKYIYEDKWIDHALVILNIIIFCAS